MALNLASICTDADLAAQVGGMDSLNRINSDIAVRDAFRASALDDVINALGSRSPAVSAYDLDDVTQLRMAVCYRALSKLHSQEITQAGDRNHIISKDFQEQYLGAMRARFTVSRGMTSPSGGTFSYERR